MDRAWYWKAGLILAVTVLSVWALVPSFTYFRLPAAERAAWHRLWGEVETVRALAQAKK